MSFIQLKFPIILASNSKIRASILAESGIEFKAISPIFNEDEAKINLQNNAISIKNIALELAIGKANSLSAIYPNCLIIGSDQICEFENKIFDKSQNKNSAIKQLLLFNNSIHTQNNGLAISLNGKIIFKKITSVKMKMRKLTDQEIENYVNFDNPVGCAGSYKYESLGKHLFQKVMGDYYSILGLSIQPILAFLYSKKLAKIKCT